MQQVIRSDDDIIVSLSFTCTIVVKLFFKGK